MEWTDWIHSSSIFRNFSPQKVSPNRNENYGNLLAAEEKKRIMRSPSTGGWKYTRRLDVEKRNINYNTQSTGRSRRVVRLRTPSPKKAATTKRIASIETVSTIGTSFGDFLFTTVEHKMSRGNGQFSRMLFAALLFSRWMIHSRRLILRWWGNEISSPFGRCAFLLSAPSNPGRLGRGADRAAVE